MGNAWKIDILESTKYLKELSMAELRKDNVEAGGRVLASPFVQSILASSLVADSFLLFFFSSFLFAIEGQELQPPAHSGD